MSSQDRIPQTLTTMEAAFTLHEDKELQEEFWRHQERMGPIAAASPGFLAVIGGPIHRSHWLYFSGKWATPQLMDKWQSEPKHKPMQDAAHSRWFASVYRRTCRKAAEAVTVNEGAGSGPRSRARRSRRRRVLLWTTICRVAWSTAADAMFGHRFHSLNFVGAYSDAFPIRKHEPLMGANFLDYVLGHFDA
jgi:hypothetical protein